MFEVEFSVERLYSGGASTCECLWGVPTVSFMVFPLLYVEFEGKQRVSWNYWRKGGLSHSNHLHFVPLLKLPLGAARVTRSGVFSHLVYFGFFFLKLASERCWKFSLGFGAVSW